MSQEEALSLAQQALNKAAEIGLASQLDAVENMAVDVRTDPLKLVQGEVDSVAIAGDGLVILQDLRLEQLDLQTGNVAINLLSAVFGKAELTQPTDANVRVVITEADINRALNSEYIRDRLRSQDLQVGSQMLRIDLQHGECSLPGDGKIAFTTGLLLYTEDKIYPLVLSLVLCISDNREDVCVQQCQYEAEGKNLPLELIAALLTKLSELLKLRYFEQKDFSLRIDRLAVEAGKVTLQVRVHVEQFSLLRSIQFG